MIRIVYVSTARLGLTDADVKQILQKAQEHNKATGITGLLVFNGLNFIQALEGDAEPVLATMSAISRDQRHSGVIVVLHQHIERRGFPEWSMRLAKAHRAGHEIAGLLDGNGVPDEVLRGVDGEVARLFTNFNSIS